MGVQSILNILTLLSCKYQEIEFIKELTEHFHFDHHLFLRDPSIDARRFIDTMGTTPLTQCVPASFDDSGLQNVVNEISSKVTFMIVAGENSEFEHNFNLLNKIKEIQRLQVNMKIGVFFEQQTSSDELQKLFVWCQNHLIIDIFATTSSIAGDFKLMCHENSFNIFTFNPFGTFQVLNVTGSKMIFDDLFPSQKSNFHQHKLRFGKPVDYPVFDDYNDANIWSTVLRMMNASLIEEDYDTDDPVTALTNGIDVIPSLFVQWNLDDLKVQTLALSRNTILVPEALPYSEFFAYMHNATSGMVFIFAFISIVGAILTLVLIRYIRTMSFFDGMRSANVLLKIQKVLGIKGYHNTNIRISYRPFSYKVNEKFLFFERLNEIIRLIQCAGLHELWVKLEHDLFERRILNINLKRLRNEDEKNIVMIEFPMFIVYGWLAGSVTFILEIVWNKTVCRSRKRK